MWRSECKGCECDCVENQNRNGNQNGSRGGSRSRDVNYCRNRNKNWSRSRNENWSSSRNEKWSGSKSGDGHGHVYEDVCVRVCASIYLYHQLIPSLL